MNFKKVLRESIDQLLINLEPNNLVDLALLCGSKKFAEKLIESKIANNHSLYNTINYNKKNLYNDLSNILYENYVDEFRNYLKSKVRRKTKEMINELGALRVGSLIGGAKFFRGLDKEGREARKAYMEKHKAKVQDLKNQLKQGKITNEKYTQRLQALEQDKKEFNKKHGFFKSRSGVLGYLAGHTLGSYIANEPERERKRQQRELERQMRMQQKMLGVNPNAVASNTYDTSKMINF